MERFKFSQVYVLTNLQVNSFQWFRAIMIFSLNLDDKKN